MPPAAEPQRRVLLHLGMHKTGSTSIQEAFEGYADDRVEYLDLGFRNHSTLLQRAFNPRAKDRVWESADRADHERERAEAQARIDAALRATHRSVILSGEDLWKFPHARACAACVAFLRDRAGPVRGLAYVRAPASYARSVFQQSLQWRRVPLGQALLVPPYRERGERWLDALGGALDFALFHPSAFRRGDLLADFAWRAGIDAARARAQGRHANRSLSAEATALLFLLREADGAAPDHGEGLAANNRLVLLLQGFGGRRFRLGPALLRPALAARAEEIAWMEAVLGRSFPEEDAEAGEVVFDSADGILALAREQGPALREHARARGVRPMSSGPDALALLRGLRDAPAPAPGRGWWRRGRARLGARLAWNWGRA